MTLANWKTQVRKGLLDLCVLNFLRRREYYGYDLVQDLKSIDGLQMREGTVYPILARLEEEGLVKSEVRPSSNGPPRKYFRITDAGRRAVGHMNAHWEHMGEAVRTARSARKGEAQ
ncbi:MAG: PadR family transcriptional regulator [Planctomycetota bacterium]|jgi:PadR family transcriptional regulator PadR